MNNGFFDARAKLEESPTLFNALRILSSNTEGRKINWKKEIDAKFDMFQDLCKEFYSKDVAIVEIQIPGQTFVRFKQSLRVNISGMIGTVGGTLGLFCGFSILAIFEILHWFCLAVVKSFQNSGGSAKRKFAEESHATFPHY